ARGPGGLRARLARHMRKDKRAHWHVDQLALAGEIVGAFILEGGDECALNAALDGFPIPLPGFGSSDCRRCEAHLRLWPKGAPLPSQWESARKTTESHLPLEAAGRGRLR
ncbi:histidine--tRNA ligase, partial [Methylocystis sp. MitZ-2018]